MKKNTQVNTNNLHVKVGDNIIVISGDDKGATGKVMAVSRKEGKVIVEKINMVKKHVKPRKQGDKGGIVEAEAAMYASKVQLYCSHCKAGRRAAHKMNENGSKERVCVKCGKKL